jgi:hypothetical protein
MDRPREGGGEINMERGIGREWERKREGEMKRQI